MMNWEAIAAIGELIGAVAVVVTLIYLAAQIRHNTKTTKAATRQAISDSAITPAQNFFTDSEFRKALNENINGKELNPDQFLYLQAYCYTNFRVWENIHYQYRAGMLSDEELASFRKNLKAIT
jgi:heme/copper-type cytochrome/quinol oxidase subunit 1